MCCSNGYRLKKTISILWFSQYILTHTYIFIYSIEAILVKMNNSHGTQEKRKQYRLCWSFIGKNIIVGSIQSQKYVFKEKKKRSCQSTGIAVLRRFPFVVIAGLLVRRYGRGCSREQVMVDQLLVKTGMVFGRNCAQVGHLLSCPWISKKPCHVCSNVVRPMVQYVLKQQTRYQLDLAARRSNVFEYKSAFELMIIVQGMGKN